MQVALVHDDLVQWGGAERVLAAISEIFPEAPIYTSVFDNKNKLLKGCFNDKKIITSFIQNIPAWQTLYKVLLPLYPIAFEQFDFSDFDLVISHTTRFAKAVITRPNCLHICYCHTPPRFLWSLSGQSMPDILDPLLSLLRIYDRITSKRVDQFIAGSINASQRIRKIYHQNSKVCQPFVDDKFFDGRDSFDGGYFLIVSRLNRYKRVDLAIKVFNKMGLNLKIVGIGPEFINLNLLAKDNVQFLQLVSEKTLVDLLNGCRALVLPGEEDFGLTALEAQAMGKAVIAFSKGGAKETVVQDSTGILFENQTEEDLEKAIKKFQKQSVRELDCINNAKRFTKKRFQDDFQQIILGAL